LRSAGGHIVHLGSALGQLDALPLPVYRESIRSAQTIQELMDLRYPADEIAKVCATCCALREGQQSGPMPAAPEDLRCRPSK